MKSLQISVGNPKGLLIENEIPSGLYQYILDVHEIPPGASRERQWLGKGRMDEITNTIGDHFFWSQYFMPGPNKILFRGTKGISVVSIQKNIYSREGEGDIFNQKGHILYLDTKNELSGFEVTRRLPLFKSTREWYAPIGPESLEDLQKKKNLLGEDLTSSIKLLAENKEVLVA